MIVAIDGPSASGKSTIGRRVARHLKLPLVDTGLMYRAMTVLGLDRGIAPNDAAAMSSLAAGIDLEVNDDPNANPGDWLVNAGGLDLSHRVYDPGIAPALAQVSQVPGVRESLVARQRRYQDGPGVVMVGRDIGTVVFPNADFKFFITASKSERTRRRARQMRDDDDHLLKGEIEDRDAADTGRSVAPLRPAEDAYTIDTDGRSPDSVFEEVLRLIDSGSAQRAGAPEA
ncbi:MAG: (d)CMP kinase [Candidatus Dormiibacterota bacterium]